MDRRCFDENIFHFAVKKHEDTCINLDTNTWNN